MLFGVVLSISTYAHQGSSTAEPRLACVEKTLGTACEWKDGHDALYIGSCRKVSESLLCVRNKPIVYPKTTHHDTIHNQDESVNK